MGRPRILCVDDEPEILEALSLHLERTYDVLRATGGATALDLLKTGGAEGRVSVILSDMRMPGMAGNEFLKRARDAAPDAVRILLTGQADMNSAIAAINDGQIFRFLTKPTSPNVLLAAVAAAAEQNRLLTSERVLLEQTLHGSIKALTEVLSLSNPTAFGRATRVKQQVTALATRLGLADRWELEVAAMLSQLASIALPPETVEKVYYDRALSEDERGMVARLPAVTEKLLGNIPRLEGVREILATYVRAVKPGHPLPRDSHANDIEKAAHVLRIAVDFDVLESRGGSAAFAIDTLRGRGDSYDSDVMEALAALRGAATVRQEIHEMVLANVRVGMIFTEDVRLQSGALLVARGFEVTPSFVEKARNFQSGVVDRRVRVLVRAPYPAAATRG